VHLYTGMAMAPTTRCISQSFWTTVLPQFRVWVDQEFDTEYEYNIVGVLVPRQINFCVVVNRIIVGATVAQYNFAFE